MSAPMRASSAGSSMELKMDESCRVKLRPCSYRCTSPDTRCTTPLSRWPMPIGQVTGAHWICSTDSTSSSRAMGLRPSRSKAPEKTYIYGEDPQGGVYVAENFYYDSEIYNTKLYAVTDRPLYRPGETVFVN